MSNSQSLENPAEVRKVGAVFGAKPTRPDPEWERGLAQHLRESQSREELMALYGQFRSGEGSFDYLMRRVLLRALCKSAGSELQVGPNVVLKHPETMEFGDSVFIGAQVDDPGPVRWYMPNRQSRVDRTASLFRCS